MSVARVTRNYQITIPAKVRKELHIDVGALLDFSVEDGVVIIKPKTLIDEEQAWFWTQEWQKGEREVDQARKKGKTNTFSSVEDMRRHFEK